jgi:hypothetical protein
VISEGEYGVEKGVFLFGNINIISCVLYPYYDLIQHNKNVSSECPYLII